MSRLLVLFLLLPPVIPAAALPHRWVYVVRNLRTDRDLDEIRQIARIASAHGLNGLVLSGGLDRLEQQPADYLERVRQVKAICAQFHLELIPQIFSAGYGGNVLSFDKNLAEGIGVTAASYVVRNGEARIEPDPGLQLVNPDLEDYKGKPSARLPITGAAGQRVLRGYHHRTPR